MRDYLVNDLHRILKPGFFDVDISHCGYLGVRIIRFTAVASPILQGDSLFEWPPSEHASYTCSCGL